MKEKTKRSRSVGVVVSLIFAVCAVLGLVWMIASGNVELALETVIRWGEDVLLLKNSQFSKTILGILPLLSATMVNA